MKKMNEANALTTHTVDGVKGPKYKCLLVYSNYCDRFGIEPKKEIETGTAKEIYEECERIYNEHNAKMS